MSVTTETEGLQREKAQLKKILRDMKDEEKYLVERLRVVEEKLEIQGLKEEMRAKGVVLDQLRSKIRELEGRLREPQREPEPSAIQKASTTLVTEKVKELQESEPVEVMVKVASRDSQQSEMNRKKRDANFFL